MLRWTSPSLLMLIPIACTSESDLSPAETGDPFAPGDASVTGDCQRCFEERCGWEASECASDPGCASWLTCARDCTADSSGSVLASCLDDCPDPDYSTGDTLRDVLVSCLNTNAGCCWGGEVPESLEGGVGGAAGSGGTNNGGNAGAVVGGPDCANEGCEDCLLAIQGQDSCAVDDDVCATAIEECYHDGEQEGEKHCWTYLTRYGTVRYGGRVCDRDSLFLCVASFECGAQRFGAAMRSDLLRCVLRGR